MIRKILKNSRDMVCNTYVTYTILFFFCSSIILFIFVLRRVSLIGDGDSLNQTYPVFVYIGEYFRKLLQGELKTFDFRIGLGEDIISILNYYGFGDFFSLLSVFFPKSFSEQAYNNVMILKLYFCGIAFLVYARRYIENNNIMIGGALTYALSVFVLFRGMGFWMFINPVILLPLILYGIDQLCIEDKKLSWMLVCSICTQALNGFYFLYVNLILSVIYFIIISCFRETQGSKAIAFFKKGISILGQVLLGVGIGGVIFIPGLIAYFNSGRTTRNVIFEEIKDLFFYDQFYYVNNLKGILIPNIWESVTTIPVILILACIVAYLSKKTNQQFKVLVAVFIVLYNIPIFGSMMNGFSEISDRWYYVVILFITILGCTAMEKELNISKAAIGLFLFLCLGIVVIDMISSEITKELVLKDTILFGCVLLTLYVYQSKKREWLLLPLICVLLIINGCFLMGPNEYGGNGYSWSFMPSGKVLQDMEESMEGIEIIRDNNFERKDIYGASLGTSLVKDYYGTSEYFSIMNNNVSQFYQELSISPGVRSASWVLKGVDGREEVMGILSVSEYTDFIVDKVSPIPYTKKNTFYLPLGFTYDKWIKREEFEQLNPLEKQRVMLEAVVLEKENCEQKKLSSDERTETKIDYHYEIKGIEIVDERIKAQKDGIMRFYLNTQKKNVYVCLKDFFVYDKGVHELYIGNKNLQLRDKDDGYYMGVDEFWINVTHLKEKDNLKYFDIIFLEECEFSFPIIEIYEHEPSMKELVKRKEVVLSNVQWENNQLSGTIEAKESKILFLSIPYSKGWKAYINGSETEIERANIGFLAISVPEGFHNISLIYTTPGIKVGGLCSIVSCIITCLVVIVTRHQKKSRSIYKQKERN